MRANVEIHTDHDQAFSARWSNGQRRRHLFRGCFLWEGFHLAGTGRKRWRQRRRWKGVGILLGALEENSFLGLEVSRLPSIRAGVNRFVFACFVRRENSNGAPMVLYL